MNVVEKVLLTMSSSYPKMHLQIVMIMTKTIAIIMVGKEPTVPIMWKQVKRKVMVMTTRNGYELCI
tara:strand:+ start:417 stop:614 length:198 start_codon:yes stop_codon:yes gene_type:complete